jgi:hypothetical protein
MALQRFAQVVELRARQARGTRDPAAVQPARGEPAFYGESSTCGAHAGRGKRSRNRAPPDAARARSVPGRVARPDASPSCIPACGSNAAGSRSMGCRAFPSAVARLLHCLALPLLFDPHGTSMRRIIRRPRRASAVHAVRLAPVRDKPNAPASAQSADPLDLRMRGTGRRRRLTRLA